MFSEVEQHPWVYRNGPLLRGSEIIMAFEEPVGHSQVNTPLDPTVGVGPLNLGNVVPATLGLRELLKLPLSILT